MIRRYLASRPEEIRGIRKMFDHAAEGCTGDGLSSYLSVSLHHWIGLGMLAGVPRLPKTFAREKVLVVVQFSSLLPLSSSLSPLMSGNETMDYFEAFFLCVCGMDFFTRTCPRENLSLPVLWWA